MTKVSGVSDQVSATAKPVAVLARLARAVRRVLGVPDYEKYLAHVRETHPTATPLSRDEFVRRQLTERYSRPGARCC